MSMYEIESVIEWSVIVVDKSNLSNSKKRNLIYSLYKFQEMFDCDWTLLRVEEILRTYNYLFLLPMDDHPKYNQLKSELDTPSELNANGFLFEDSAVYPNKNSFYCEAGSPTWSRLVAQGKMNDEGAKAVIKLPLLEMVQQLTFLIKEQKETELASEWYGVMFYLVSDIGYYELNKEEYPLLEAISKQLFFSDEVFSMLSDSMLLKNGGLQYMVESSSEDVQFWLGPYLKWTQQNSLLKK